MSDPELDAQRKKTSRNLMWAAVGLSVAIAGLMAQFDDNTVQANEATSEPVAQVQESEDLVTTGHAVNTISENVIVQTVVLPDGRQVELLQVFPTANREFVCLGTLGKYGNRLDRVVMTGGGCFPAKTNPSPTMY